MTSYAVFLKSSKHARIREPAHLLVHGKTYDEGRRLASLIFDVPEDCVVLEVAA